MTAGNPDGVASIDGMMEPDEVADVCVRAIAAEEFLILPHAEVLDYMRNKDGELRPLDWRHAQAEPAVHGLTMAAHTMLDRRRLLRAAGSVAGIVRWDSAAASSVRNAPEASAVNTVPHLAPVRAQKDRLFDITVCLRPFRAAGPRLDAEQIGRKLVVHNYGHGGSGWSLSWGSATIALRKAMTVSPRRIAVIGCGAVGTTTALLAREAGLDTTIYARDLLPDTRSARATGSWTPDSRIALTSAAAPGFGDLWEEMARISFKRYRRYLGLPGSPVEWTDRYYVSDLARDQAATHQPDDPLGFASYHDRIRDLTPVAQEVPPENTPFPVASVRRTTQMMFNVADYGHTLLNDYLEAGGRIERREFHALGDVTQLSEDVIINCTGYAARELCKDETVVPVRGQNRLAHSAARGELWRDL